MPTSHECDKPDSMTKTTEHVNGKSFIFPAPALHYYFSVNIIIYYNIQFQNIK